MLYKPLCLSVNCKYPYSPISKITMNECGTPGSWETILATEEAGSDTAQTNRDRRPRSEVFNLCPLKSSLRGRVPSKQGSGSFIQVCANPSSYCTHWTYKCNFKLTEIFNLKKVVKISGLNVLSLIKTIKE